MYEIQKKGNVTKEVLHFELLHSLLMFTKELAHFTEGKFLMFAHSLLLRILSVAIVYLEDELAHFELQQSLSSFCFCTDFAMQGKYFWSFVLFRSRFQDYTHICVGTFDEDNS